MEGTVGVNFAQATAFSQFFKPFPAAKDSFTHATHTWDLKVDCQSLIGQGTHVLPIIRSWSIKASKKKIKL